MIASEFLIAFGLCAGLVALSAGVVWGMTHVGVLDIPGARSSHARPTPKGGGVGIVVAFVVGVAAVAAFGLARLTEAPWGMAILAALGLAIVGYFDDRLAWPAWVKLLAQCAAAGLAVAGGLWVGAVDVPLLGVAPLGWLGLVGSFAWIIVATNAMNFIDGLNGLAAGVTAMACGFLVIVAGQAGAEPVFFVAILLAAGLLGFLPFNVPKARIFMGDVGSQFCGFMLAALALATGRLPAMPLGAAVVPMLLFGVLFDVAFTLLQRARRGERLSEAHRGHLYQIAQRSGVAAMRVTLVHWGFAAWGGVCGIALLHAAPGWRLLWLALVVPPQGAWLVWVRKRARRSGLSL